MNAQKARRVLDRLVGYNLSPLLWAKVKNGLSAGRVQSVALRLICEREEEVENFIPEEYWSLDADFVKGKTKFTAQLVKYKDENPELNPGLSPIPKFSLWKVFHRGALAVLPPCHQKGLETK